MSGDAVKKKVKWLTEGSRQDRERSLEEEGRKRDRTGGRG